MKKLRFFVGIFALGLVLCLTVVTRSYTFPRVFAHGGIYFADGDCYSRMTRVRAVMEHPLHPAEAPRIRELPPRHRSPHDFPFRLFDSVLAWMLSPLTPRNLDVAGAIVSPLLGLGMAVFLLCWTTAIKLPFRGATLFFHAVSPILVHGTALGRPDHQSFQMFLMAAGLGAEWIMASSPTRGWGIVSGLAWSVGLWTSLYEPGALFVAVVFLYLLLDRRSLLQPQRWAGYAVFVAVIILGLTVDGWWARMPDAAVVRYFPAWEKTIGELATVAPLDPILFRWVGFGLVSRAGSADSRDSA